MKFINSYATLNTRLYHRQPPTPLANPKAGHFNPIVAQQIGWDSDKNLMDNWVDILSGNLVPEGFAPLAMAYAGHQFGQWAGQLGDGRGLLMAQVEDCNGQLTDLHLKGMGLTPYSRMGDGRAVLRSTIREYLCGHAMSSLGIRSSNALGFVTSDTPVRRETMESGAALMRVADTHIRLGHVEWIATFAPELLGEFTHHMIATYYPDVIASATPIHDFITQVVQNTAKMIADWQLIGFAHGVMNTDNLSITGTTIDYGPFGFLERFNPAWINNHSDYSGRYAYQNQPAIGHWNLNVWMRHFIRLSEQDVVDGITEVITQDSLAECLNHYESTFTWHYQQGVCRKLGLNWQLINQTTAATETTETTETTNAKEGLDATQISDDSREMINATLVLAFEFLEILEQNRLDYTNGFRALIALVQSIHPTLVMPSDHEAQLLAQLGTDIKPEHQLRWQEWRFKYKNHISDLVATNKSLSLETILNTLQQSNPVYVLRNTMAQRAIEQAKAGDFSEVDRLFNLLITPYRVNEIAMARDTIPPAQDEPPIVISCSS